MRLPAVASSLLAALLALAGCGGGGSAGPGTGGGGAPPAPTVYFQDDLSAGFPGMKWIVTRSAGNDPPPDSLGIDSGNGQPAPALYCEVNGSVNYSMRNTTLFPAFPIRIAFDLRVAAGSDGHYVIATMATPTGALLAGIRVHRAKVSVLVNNGQYIDFPGDTSWHAYEYSEDPSGNTRWSRDGVTLVSGFNPTLVASQCFFGLGTYVPAPGGPEAHLDWHADNLRITSP